MTTDKKEPIRKHYNKKQTKEAKQLHRHKERDMSKVESF